MGSPMRLADFERRFRAYGVAIHRHRATHLVMKGIVAGETVVYVAVAKHGKTVDDIYVAKARRRFGLTPEKGVSNEEFLSK